MQALVCVDLSKYFTRKKRRRLKENDNKNASLFLRMGHLLKLLLREKQKIKAVDAVSFEVERGEIYGILGPNGSGKSTLIRLISTLLLPDSGEIKIFGFDVVKDHMQVRRLLNRVSVDSAFFKSLSSYANLIYAARLYGIPKSEAKRRSKEILSRLGFNLERMNEPMENLSRGMQQKVAIARALLTSPILLLLDEPTTGLDPKSKRDLQTFIQEFRSLHDVTIILTTHDMDEADKLCDRLAIIDNGKFIVEGTPSELKRKVTKGDGQQTLVTLEDVFIKFTGKQLEGEED